MPKELYNVGDLGVNIVFKANEGNISIVTTAGIGGSRTEPALSAGIKKGDWVELSEDLEVVKATTGFVIGRAKSNPRDFVKEPATGYTASQARTAGYQREVVIETVFKKIITLDAVSSSGITYGNYLVRDSSDVTKVKQSASSGTTASDMVALADVDSDGQVIVGII